MTILEIRRGTADANGLQIAYEDMGDAADPAIVLIMGFSAQLTMWPIELCRLLVDGGYRLIRFDNRDIGLSTKVDGVRVKGSKLARILRRELGLATSGPYSLADMAEDVVGLFDHLGIESAHLVGASMGGMIAQIFTAEHPERVRSLGIIFSTTNQPLLPPPSPAAVRALIGSPGKNPTREQVIDMIVKSAAVIGSPKYPESEDELRIEISANYDRSHYPAGVIRQFAAATGAGNLVRYARSIQKPTVVIHGSADPLLRPANGRAVAKAIAGAELHMIDGMGHNLPAQLLPQLSQILLANFDRST